VGSFYSPIECATVDCLVDRCTPADAPWCRASRQLEV